MTPAELARELRLNHLSISFEMGIRGFPDSARVSEAKHATDDEIIAGYIWCELCERPLLRSPEQLSNIIGAASSAEEFIAYMKLYQHCHER